jgi:hypothetical protein
MSTYNRALVLIGLTLVGSLGWATVRDPADEPEPPSPAAPAAERPAAPERFLLLTNGQLIKGIVSRQGTEYLVIQRVGVMRFPEKRVESVFNSVREAYQYRVEQLPDRDYDERMKLALWCLKMNLIPEATEQLTEIARHNPNHRQAQAMLDSIDQAATRAALRPHDPEVRQTRGPDEMNDPRPGALDSAVIRRAIRELGVSNLPVIFDLPIPLAIKRADEFARHINPLLQVNCAKCHNGDYDGRFQLVPTKNRSDRTPDALRANLDATLRLVDPMNPSHSELLSSTLRAHGRGPRPKPIFPGSNDPTYQILAAWVHKLCPPVPVADANRADRGQSPSERVEPFAVERDRVGTGFPNPIMPSVPVRTELPEVAGRSPAQPTIPPPSRILRGGGSAAEGPNPADPQEFPLPFVISGVKPKLPSDRGATKSAPTSAGSGASKAESALAKSETPKDSKQKDGSGTEKKPPKPLKLDPKLLERALQNRNSGR